MDGEEISSSSTRDPTTDYGAFSSSSSLNPTLNTILDENATLSSFRDHQSVSEEVRVPLVADQNSHSNIMAETPDQILNSFGKYFLFRALFMIKKFRAF